MSAAPRKHSSRSLRTNAPIFAALGHEARLALLTTLGRGSRFSITRLTEESPLTRQAITKHLRVLENAGLVRATRQGRETLYQLESTPLAQARQALDRISRQWDTALARLQAFVEDEQRIQY